MTQTHEALATERGDLSNETILVGVDESQAADAALRWALTEAEWRRAEVQAVYVWPTTAASAAGVLVRGSFPIVAEAKARRVVAESLRRSHYAGAVPVHIDVKIGSPMYELRFAASEEADLTVIGAHTHRALHDAVTGCSTTILARRATHPLVVVPARCKNLAPGPIVVGVDPHGRGSAGLAWAIREASVRRTVVRVVTVGGRGNGQWLLPAAVRPKGVKVSWVMRQGVASDALLDESRQAAMLVLGGPARSTWAQLLSKSEIRACVRRSRVPVVLVPGA